MNCVCSHVHEEDCHCGCTIFTPDDGETDIGQMKKYILGAYHHEPTGEPYPF